MLKQIKLLTFILVMITATTIFAREDTIHFTEELPSMTKEMIYSKAIFWIGNRFTSADEVIQYKNAEEGKIVCTTIGSFHENPYIHYFRYTLTIIIKNNKIFLTYSNFDSADCRTRIDNPSIWKKIVKRITASKNNLISTIKKPVKKKDVR